MKQYAALDDTVYFWFAANDTSGSGGDGASPAADVRLAGAAADAAPVYSPTPTLLTHANYPAGAHEIAIAATAANGFAATNTYAVFCTLTIDSQNPTGFVGSFDLKPVQSNMIQYLGSAAAAVPDANITHINEVAVATDTAQLGVNVVTQANIDFGALQKASINTEVADVITVDTTSEPSQGAPPETPTFEEMLSYMYFKLRNKGLTTATEDAMYDNAGTTKIMKAVLSDDGTTFTKGEYGTGA